jgi:hypothetical protein
MARQEKIAFQQFLKARREAGRPVASGLRLDIHRRRFEARFQMFLRNRLDRHPRQPLEGKTLTYDAVKFGRKKPIPENVLRLTTRQWEALLRLFLRIY